MIFQLQLI
ncbi:unnamed protein product [Aphis gossypii]|uniref:Uncharacterized protein n=1 Tax=Aphis gossypii TaxID=80765 RepID=A0A9P0NUA6_APHGO|nr:unnamed protein product [Aphis gossypii]